MRCSRGLPGTLGVLIRVYALLGEQTSGFGAGFQIEQKLKWKI